MDLESIYRAVGRLEGKLDAHVEREEEDRKIILSKLEDLSQFKWKMMGISGIAVFIVGVLSAIGRFIR